jgi:phage terminase large subunit-like protein
MRLRIEKAREDPADFIEFVWRTPQGEPIKLEPFHREWLSHFQSSRRVQIEAARAHGKTTIVLAYVVWRIGRDPSIRIKLFTQSERRARERLFEVSEAILKNELIKLVFPDLAKSKAGIWSKTAITTERAMAFKDPTLEAAGIMSSVEGARADLIIFDDICDVRNSIMFPQFRETIKTKIYGELMPLLEEGGAAMSIATPHHRADAVASLRVNPEWDSYIYPVGTPEDPFVPLWPGRWPRKALKRLRGEIGGTEYNRAYRCIAISKETVPIQGEWIQFYNNELLGDPWDLICVQAYDLAIAQHKKADFFACVTLLYDPKRNFIFVADAWHDKLSFADQAKSIEQGARRWQPQKIAIEETGYQGALRSYLLDMTESPLPVYPVKPRGSKERRLIEITPLFEDGRVFFNPKLDPQSNMDIDARGDIISELLSFPLGVHDDLVDSFVHGCLSLMQYREAAEEEDWIDGDGVNSRLSFIGN